MNDRTASDTCIFCGIAAGRLPSSVVHQDDAWMAVMDIHPIREGHVLIIPKHHLARLSELSPFERETLFALADAIVRAQEAAGYAAGGSNFLLNDGVAANQHIPHLHLHCIPRKRGDTVGFGLRLLARTFGLFGRSVDRETLDRTAARIAQHLAFPPRDRG